MRALTITMLAVAFAVGYADSQEGGGDSKEIDLFDKAAKNADLYKLDRSVPVSPGLAVAGLSNLEGTGHYMSPDFVFDTGVSDSGQPTFGASFRPFWISPAARNWKIVDCGSNDATG